MESDQITEEPNKRSPIGRRGMNVCDLCALWDEVSGGFLVIVGNCDPYDPKAFRMSGELIASLTNSSARAECDRSSEEEEILDHNISDGVFWLH